MYVYVIHTITSLLLASVTVSAVQNEFIGKTLGSHMVLQRDVNSRLYGYSMAAGATVTVTFGSVYASAVSSLEEASDGGYRWVVKIPPMVGSLRSYDIHITSSVGEAAILEDVAFGDVYLCSGQSNMQFAVPGDFDAEAEIEAAEDYPYVRIMSVGQGYDLPQVTLPLEDLYFLDMPWTVGSSESVATGDWTYRYSAICWFFGKNVFDNSLNRSVPVGLVSDNWGGTVIEAWSPPSVMEKCYSVEMEVKNADYDPIFSNSEFDPNVYSSLYNTMIYPFRDMTIKGALWYQGESNVAYAETYPCLQNEMVKAWRALMGVNFAFLFVQLSTWNNGGGYVLSNFRFAQVDALSLMENTAMITAADLGDPESPYGTPIGIHPRNKTEVGRRLALAADSLLYSGTDVPYLGPLVESVTTFEDPYHGKSIRVTFNAQSCGDGIHMESPQECPEWSVPGGCGEVVLQYMLEQVKGVVSISGQNMVDIVPVKRMRTAPTYLYYCLGDYPLMRIYNSFGVPTAPFASAVAAS